MFWQGTKGISKQTFKSLSLLLTGQREQRYRQQPNLQNHRDNLVHEVTRRVKSLQKSQGQLTPSTLKQSEQKYYLSCHHTTHIHTYFLSFFISCSIWLLLIWTKISQPCLSFLEGKKNSTPVKEKRLRSSEGTTPSIQKAKRLQPKALIPTPTPRSNAPPQIQTPKTKQKKNRYTFFLQLENIQTTENTNENENMK